MSCCESKKLSGAECGHKTKNGIQNLYNLYHLKLVKEPSTLSSNSIRVAVAVDTNLRNAFRNIVNLLIELAVDLDGGRRLAGSLLSLSHIAVPVDNTTGQQDALAVVEGASTNVRVENPVLLVELSSSLVAALVDRLALVVAAGLDPLAGLVLVVGVEGSALLEELVSGLDVLLLVILALGGLGVGVDPVLVTLKLLDEVVGGDELLETGAAVGELDLVGDDGVEPAVDDAPDTLEDPRGVVDEQNTQTFGVVALEALDDEFDGVVVHVGEGETCQVKDDGLGDVSELQSLRCSESDE